MQLLKGEVGLTTALVVGKECGQAGCIPLSTGQMNLCWGRNLGEFNLNSAVLLQGPETPPSPLL